MVRRIKPRLVRHDRHGPGKCSRDRIRCGLPADRIIERRRDVGARRFVGGHSAERAKAGLLAVALADGVRDALSEPHALSNAEHHSERNRHPQRHGHALRQRDCEPELHAQRQRHTERVGHGVYHCFGDTLGLRDEQ